MQAACARIPSDAEVGSGPALIGISWDAGNASKRRSYTPILLSVGNTDYAGPKVCTCIAFMPQLELNDKDRQSPQGQQALHELKQACAGAIIEIIERSAASGFKCMFHTGERHLFPVLVKMEFDTKERYKFFACSRQRACAIGSGPRKGRSAFRKCTAHSSRDDLKRKRLIVDGVITATEDEATQAAESLKRRGLHPHFRCTSLSNCRHSIIRWPGRLYHGLFAFDVMHIMYINWIGHLQETLLSTMTRTQKNNLDRRVRKFSCFVKPDCGTTSRKVTSLVRIGYMSAEMRVLHLFIWSHALGSKALLLHHEIREYALSSIASMQIMCFSVRSKRPYTESEHRYDFVISHCIRHYIMSCLCVIQLSHCLHHYHMSLSYIITYGIKLYHPYVTLPMSYCYIISISHCVHHLFMSFAYIILIYHC